MNASETTNSRFDRNQKFIFHEDAGHGWLQVPFDLLKELKIQNEITGFSYRKGDFAYLEEDLDLSTFLKAYFSSLEIPLNPVNVQQFWSRIGSTNCDYSEIRGYRHYYLS